MFNHERLRELIALGSLGQLSSDENREIEEHLRECEDCRSVQEDYSRIIFHELPKTDPFRWRSGARRSRRVRDAELRDRFLARAIAEGIGFSRDVEKLQVGQTSPLQWISQWRPALAATALVAAMLLAGLIGRRYPLVPSVPALNPPASSRSSEIQRLQTQTSSFQSIIQQQSAQLAAMGRKNSVSDESLRRLQANLGSAQASEAELTAELSLSRSESSSAERTGQQKDNVIADLRSQNEALNRQSSDSLSDSVIQAARIRQLTESLDEERASLDRERQLMAVSNDVRQLMGARNLHIVDVLDVNDEGRSNKAFGRVFYAEGQSLIFYAFDLPSAGLSAAKYTFNAWGQEEARPRSPRKLGVFDVDSHDQRRWVLKINDSALLTRIDSVFVTAESLGEAKQPRGKKLLYAYIGGQPNHP